MTLILMSDFYAEVDCDKEGLSRQVIFADLFSFQSTSYRVMKNLRCWKDYSNGFVVVLITGHILFVSSFVGIEASVFIRFETHIKKVILSKNS